MNLKTAAAVAVLAFALTGCDSSTQQEASYAGSGCDREDLRNFEDDCGYWDGSGAFVLWYWVTPGVGGVRPDGWFPKLPPGASTVRPANAKLTAPRQQPAPNGVTAPKADRPGSKVNAPAAPRNAPAPARPAPPAPRR